MKHSFKAVTISVSLFTFCLKASKQSIKITRRIIKKNINFYFNFKQIFCPFNVTIAMLLAFLPLTNIRGSIGKEILTFFKQKPYVNSFINNKFKKNNMIKKNNPPFIFIIFITITMYQASLPFSFILASIEEAAFTFI